MPHTIEFEKEKIIKEKYNYHNYTNNNIWLNPLFVNINRNFKLPRFTQITNQECDIKVEKNNIEINVQDFKLQLPYALNMLSKEIEHSKYLIELKEDWDDEGGLPIKFETWKRATNFVVNYAMWLYNDQQHFVIEPPQINPGPVSSIDLLWRNEKYRLLINISENSEEPIEYYGDNNRGENSIKGKLKSGPVHEFFALWLKNLKY